MTAPKNETLEDVQKKYTDLCFKIGQIKGTMISIQYDLNMAENDLKNAEEEMKRLILKGSQLKREKTEKEKMEVIAPMTTEGEKVAC